MSVKTITLGCRLNAYESERMAEIAEDAGVRGATIVNTCAVTQRAVADSRQAVRKALSASPDEAVYVTGCAAQIHTKEFKDISGSHKLIGNTDKLRTETWRQLKRGNAPDLSDAMQARDLPFVLPAKPAINARAMVQVQSGCDHRCTFCIIPFGRGNSRSLRKCDVIEKIKRLVGFGHKEIVLTGVDLTSWGDDLGESAKLGDLVQAILRDVPDLPQLRISSIDAIEIDPAFKSVLAEPRLAPYLHLSLQHGDTLILKRMKRRHTREDAVTLCHELRAIRPDIAFGADIIAGFPTETEAQFENSKSLIDEIGLAFVHVFPFSPRPTTPAARMPQLPQKTIKARASLLRDAATEAQRKHLSQYIGTSQIALSESGNKARLPDFSQIVLEGNSVPVGEFINVEIRKQDGKVLSGKWLSGGIDSVF